MRISDWSSDVCSSDLCRNRWASFNEIVFDEPAQLPAGRRAQSRRFEGFGSCALKEKIATGREIKADDVRANNAVPKVRARAAHHRGRTALACGTRGAARPLHQRSEEQTSELQSLMRISYAVFCLKTQKITS